MKSWSRLSLGTFVSLTVLASGTNARAAEEVSPQASPPASSQTSSQTSDEEVARKTIHVTTAMLSPRRNNSLSPRRFVPMMGDGTSLKGAKFYLAVGRPDLADTYRRRQRIRWGLFGGGASLLVVGMGVAIAGSVRNPENRTMTIAGLSVASAGLLTTTAANVFAHFAPAHPIEPAVAKDLIDQHNAQVQAQAASGASARIRVGPQLTASSAGLVLSGRF